MKAILAAHHKEYIKSIKQSPEKREAEATIWVNMTANLLEGGNKILKALAAEHAEVEKASKLEQDDLKDMQNRHIRIRNRFAALYKIEPEPLLK